jgi:hypothetical protein
VELGSRSSEKLGVPVPESAGRQQQQRKKAEEALSPTEEGGSGEVKKSSKGLTTLVGSTAGSGSESTGTAGGRGTRKA